MAQISSYKVVWGGEEGRGEEGERERILEWNLAFVIATCCWALLLNHLLIIIHTREVGVRLGDSDGDDDDGPTDCWSSISSATALVDVLMIPPAIYC